MVCIMSRIGVSTLVATLLLAIQIPTGMPITTQIATATKVMISVSMLSPQ